MKRVFLIVLDSVGIGEMPDAEAYGDKGTNTLKAAASSAALPPAQSVEAGDFQSGRRGLACG